jgi:hypothetical protein
MEVHKTVELIEVEGLTAVVHECAYPIFFHLASFMVMMMVVTTFMGMLLLFMVMVFLLVMMMVVLLFMVL